MADAVAIRDVNVGGFFLAVFSGTTVPCHVRINAVLLEECAVVVDSWPIGGVNPKPLKGVTISASCLRKKLSPVEWNNAREEALKIARAPVDDFFMRH